MPSRHLWKTCCQELVKKLNPHNYESWIQPLEVNSFRGSELSLNAPSRFFVEWIEEHYEETIIDIMKELTGEVITLTFTTGGKGPAPKVAGKGIEAPPPEASPSLTAGRSAANLNEKYTFKNFVVDKSNEFCFASSRGVADNLGKGYNPLFIYGGVGLGKTHLMQAIGNAALMKNGGAQVLYVSSEKFVNDLINSLQRNAMGAFREKYRTLDLLVIDDIQFISGKERTQEEFFHTFNTLFEDKKQIVISSDKVPKDIVNLEERLRSRFSWGLIADIQPPELELKIAIAGKMLVDNGFEVSKEVTAYLANRVKSNIRELEGVLSRVMAYATLTGRTIDIDMAQDTLKGIYDDTVKTIDIRQIQRTIADFYQIKLGDLKSKSRKKHITLARQVAMYLAREFTNNSLPEIGRLFGGRDHTTVIHSVEKIKHQINIDTRIYNEITEVKRRLDL